MKVTASRQLAIVLGMHRSGTSALTRVVNLLGAALPPDLIPCTSDNQRGYWESHRVLEINEALLAAAGTLWKDDALIRHEWFDCERALGYLPKAAALLEETFNSLSPADCPTVVLKDPRICRLMPFWRKASQAVGAKVVAILAVRDPEEVFRSLAARAENPKFRWSGITCRARSHVLWLRYVLESERYTRDLDRTVVTFENLLSDWSDTIRRAVDDVNLRLRTPMAEAAPAVEQFLCRSLRGHINEQEAEGSSGLPSEVYRLFAESAVRDVPLDTTFLDAVLEALNSIEKAYAPLRREKRLVLNHVSPWHNEMLTQIQSRTVARFATKPRVLYVSSRPEVRSHMYRVTHRVSALKAAGTEATWVRLEDAAGRDALEADIVVLFRQPWCDEVARIHATCQAQRIPCGFDIDDLLFDPAVMTVKNFDFFRQRDEDFRIRYLRGEVGGCRRTLCESDFAVVSTQPLARAATEAGTPAYVLSNGFDPATITQADAAIADPTSRPSLSDGLIRIGYASGTPTHQKDFGTVTPTLAALLEERAAVLLTIVGHLDLQEFPELLRYRERIEVRPFVPHNELCREYRRFDINLAPLEHGNPFCEGKSELKYYEAALAETPTVATPTAPFRAAIKDGETGYCARTPEEWKDRLIRMLDDADERSRMGRNARIHAIAAFGPEVQSAASLEIFDAIVRRFCTGAVDRSYRPDRSASALPTEGGV